jgi:hypothetical protein
MRLVSAIGDLVALCCLMVIATSSEGIFKICFGLLGESPSALLLECDSAQAAKKTSMIRNSSLNALRLPYGLPYACYGAPRSGVYRQFVRARCSWAPAARYQAFEELLREQ